MIRKARQTLFVVTSMALMLAQLVLPLGSLAQDEPAPVDFLVGAYTCPYDPGAVSIFGGTVPEDCLPVASVPIDVVVNGTENRACTTDGGGVCYVSVPADATLLITQLSPRAAVQGTFTKQVAEGDAVFVFVEAPVIEETLPAPDEDTDVEEIVIEGEDTGDDLTDGSTEEEDVDESLPDDSAIDDGASSADDGSTGEEDVDGPLSDDGVTDNGTSSADDGFTEEEDVDESLSDDDVIDGQDTSSSEDGSDEDAIDETASGTGVAEEDSNDDVSVDDGSPQSEDANETVADDVVIEEDITGNLPEDTTSNDQDADDSSIGDTISDEGDTDKAQTGDDELEVSDPSSGEGDSSDVTEPVEDTSSDHESVVIRDPNSSDSAKVENQDLTGSPVADDAQDQPKARTAVRMASVTETPPPAMAPMSLAVPAQAPAPLNPVLMYEQVTSGLTCYTEPNSGSTAIKQVAAGALIGVTGSASGGWLPVRCGEQNAFVWEAATSAYTAPTLKPVISYERITSGLTCYSAPHYSSTAIKQVPAGTLIGVTGVANDGWVPVRCGERNAFVREVSTTVNKTSALKPVISYERVTSGLTCYSAPHYGSTVIQQVAAGTYIGVTGAANGGWIPVRCGDRNAFVREAGTSLSTAQTLKPILSQEQVTSGLICYSAPHTGSTKIRQLAAGTFIGVTGAANGGWIPVRCGDRNAFVQEASTSAYKTPVLKSVVSYEQVTNRLTCYSAPHTGSTAIKQVAVGTLIGVTGTANGGWIPVRCGDRNAFVREASTSAYTTPVLKSVVSYEQVTSSLTCYSAPHYSSTSIKQVSVGTLISVTGSSSGGWLPVRCGERNAFVREISTTVHKSPLKPVVAYEQVTSGLTCYSAPHYGSTSIKQVSAGTLISVIGSSNGGWLPVRCGERNAFVREASTSLSAGQALKSGTGYTAILGAGSSGVVCRTAPHAKSSTITSLADGVLVATTGSASNGWVPVQCGGRNGYIASASTTKVLSHKGIDGNVYTAKVTGTNSAGLMCRTSPVTGSRITVLPEGVPVEVFSWSEGWARVKCAGTTGYASLQYLKFLTGESGAATGEYWIDVNLTTQYMVVYQGNTILGQMYVSTGRWPLFETPTGNFYINNKIRIQDMAGCSEGECWYVHDVEWVMYFTNEGHAFHSAPWHNNFGTRMSHGCVNLPPAAAEWLYNITPYGTRIFIHY